MRSVYRRIRLFLAIVVLIACLPKRTGDAHAQSQSVRPLQPNAVEVPGFTLDPNGNVIEREQQPAPPLDRRTLDLPKLTGPDLPPAPPVLEKPRIPSPFLGCWSGKPIGFDSVISSPGSFTLGSPGKIVFCYRQDHIDVRDANIAFSFNAGIAGDSASAGNWAGGSEC